MKFRGAIPADYHRKYFFPSKCCSCGDIYFSSATSGNPHPRGLYPVRHKTAFTCSLTCSKKIHRMNPRLKKLTKQNYKRLTWEEFDELINKIEEIVC